MRPCRDCGKDFAPKPWQSKNADWQCRECRKVKYYARPLRDEREWRHGYNRRPEVKERHAKRMRAALHDPKHREKILIRVRTRTRVASGEIAKGPCVNCGATENLQAHHPNYKEQYRVEWLCRVCHVGQHTAERRAGRL